MFIIRYLGDGIHVQLKIHLSFKYTFYTQPEGKSIQHFGVPAEPSHEIRCGIFTCGVIPDFEAFLFQIFE